MKFIRTIRLQLSLTPEQEQLLNDTIEANRSALNFASQIAFENGGAISAFSLHRLAYRKLRSTFGIPAQMACTICRTVAGVYKSMRSNQHEMTQACFHHPKLAFQWNKDYSIRNGMVSLSTLKGRVLVPFQVQPPYQKYLDGGFEFGAAELVRKRKGWFLHVSVSKEEAEPVGCDSVVGIDQGMRFLITAFSENQKPLFIRVGKVKQTRLDHVRLRRQLERKGTRSARKRLRSVGRRESRYMTDVNHQIANQVVTYAKASGEHPVIALENLDGINLSVKVRLKDRYWRMSWAFGQLATFIRYKAEDAGIRVVLIDETNTSLECPRCHHVERANRSRKHHRFLCKECGYQLNDDLVASMNISARGWEEIRKSQSA